MDDHKPTNSLALAALLGAAAMASVTIMEPSRIMDPFGAPLMDERPRPQQRKRKAKSKAADPAKKAARKRQGAARAKNRRK